jgi:NAD dependent epimerase/dehydratase family enzyme
MPWIEIDDIVGIYLAALDDDRYSGAINATAPQPATNREFSKALGSVLHRPAVVPVPRLALRLAFGEMGEVVTGSQNAVPARPLELGYRFRHPELEGALRAALA